MTARWFSIYSGVSVVALGASICGCKAEPDASARQWFRCSCSYISDFDEPGSAPVDVCSEKKHAADVAAACTRNAGVGVPTGCQCEMKTEGSCDRSDRCRAAGEPRK